MKPTLDQFLDSYTVDAGLNGRANLYDFQKDVIKGWHKHRYNVLVNARQVGATTMIVADTIYSAMYEQKQCMILTPLRESFINHLGAMFHSSIAFNCRSDHHSYSTLSKRRIEFFEGGSIQFDYSERDVRGCSPDVCHVTDFDYYGNKRDDLLKSLMPIISTRKNVAFVASSTPNDRDGVIKLADNPLFNAVTLPWTVVPDRGDKWKDEMIKLCGEESFKHEFECLV